MISQLMKYFDRCYLMYTAQNLRNEYKFSGPEIAEICDMCHCMVYDINMKNVLKQIKRKAHDILNSQKTGAPKPVNSEAQFIELMKTCLQSFFVRINFDERPIYLYRVGNNEQENNQLQNFRGIGTLHNQYLKSILSNSGVDSGNISDNYFLIVEVSIAFKKKKKKKIFFKDADEFIRILAEQAQKDLNCEKDTNCWLRFKNYFPRRKGEKNMNQYSTFGKGTLKQVGEFIENSQKMYETIVERISEIKVVDGMQSLASTYVNLPTQ